METLGKPTDRDAEQLRRDLDALRRDFAQLSSRLSGSSARRLRAGADAARAGISQAQQQAWDVGCGIGREVGARPLASAAAVTGLGFLVLAYFLAR